MYTHKTPPALQAIGYSAIPTGRNEEGLVALVLKKKQEEVMAAQQQVVDTITTKILGKPNLSVCVEGVRPVPEDRWVLLSFSSVRTGESCHLGVSHMRTG